MNVGHADTVGKFTIIMVEKDATKTWVMITAVLNLNAIVALGISRQIIYNTWKRNMTDQNWLSNLATKAMRICRLNKQAAGNHRQDMSRPVLDDLASKGYTQVMWNSNGSHHSQCLDLNRQVWNLQDFLATTEYDAPLFSRSHPGDASCTLTVSGPGLPNVEVDSYGDVDTAIGTQPKAPAPKPAPVQEPIQVPTIKPLAPEKPVVERTPEKPETKVRQVPKEVHKQIKDPFEKERLTDDEYLQWLKELEQEQVQESIPATPEQPEKKEL